MGCALSTHELKASWGVMKAVDSNDKALLLRSLQNGGSPNGLPDKYGTALHRAVHNKSVVMVKILIEQGADLTVLDAYKRTPLDIALIRNLTRPCETRIRIQKLLEAARDQLFVSDLQNALKRGKKGDTVLLSNGPSPLPVSTAQVVTTAETPTEAPTHPRFRERLNSLRGVLSRDASTSSVKKEPENKDELELSSDEEEQAAAKEEVASVAASCDEENLCILCQDNPSQVAVLPCNHECLCLPCAVRTVPFVLQGVMCVQTCPICRGAMDALLVTHSDENRKQEVAATGDDDNVWQPRGVRGFTCSTHVVSRNTHEASVLLQAS
mmetsp:Transcript_522/g.1153  ORF Transcript_522/g.1153 Transcript_522/m.1153 type:complete len:325 (-) Transcript_522:5-979(-)|eukprot:CAMPEP_0118956878 /NCGR_PEP_ID=MMETSP1169-20130426/61809_1 /TAXON_ID=36882 /ORGANISM="Pyramimonas obovata, Strain CCMP722" /LENGTH=324 /DNA_ID=CAMNT_0006904927 /DNA_START=137 /DNA_END=1111 /DNA_ORIENTATION=+